MKIQAEYRTRFVRFIEQINHRGWRIKIYSISERNEFVSEQNMLIAKLHLDEWLKNTTIYSLDTYQIATLILHEGKEGCFAIINWWIDENMLQQFVYLATQEKPYVYELYSDKGIITCVWEMAVLWFERNAWVDYVLKKAGQPDFESYLLQQFNADV